MSLSFTLLAWWVTLLPYSATACMSVERDDDDDDGGDVLKKAPAIQYAYCAFCLFACTAGKPTRQISPSDPQQSAFSFAVTLCPPPLNYWLTENQRSGRRPRLWK